MAGDNESGEGGGAERPDGDEMDATNVSLSSSAYRLSSVQMVRRDGGSGIPNTLGPNAEGHWKTRRSTQMLVMATLIVGAIGGSRLEMNRELSFARDAVVACLDDEGIVAPLPEEMPKDVAKCARLDIVLNHLHFLSPYVLARTAYKEVRGEEEEENN